MSDQNPHNRVNPEASDVQASITVSPLKLSDLIDGAILDKRHLGIPVERLVRAISVIDPELADKISTTGRYSIFLRAVTLADVKEMEAAYGGPFGSVIPGNANFGRNPLSGMQSQARLAVFSEDLNNGVLLTVNSVYLNEHNPFGPAGFVNGVLNLLLNDNAAGLGFGR